jgi:hypothetical protein
MIRTSDLSNSLVTRAGDDPFSFQGSPRSTCFFSSAALPSDGTVLIPGGEDQFPYQDANFLDYVPLAEKYQSTEQPVAPDSLEIILRLPISWSEAGSALLP